MSLTESVQTRRVLPIITSVTFIGFLDTTLLVPIMALYAAELGAGVGITGLIIGLYSIVNTPANVFFGRLIDRVGHKFPLIAGLVGDALGMVLYILCRSPLHLALVRVFHGITGAIAGPATMSAIAAYSSREREGRTMGIYGMSIAAANLVGFGLSGVIRRLMGYQWLFCIGAMVLTVGAGLGWLLPGGGQRVVPAEQTQRGGPSNIRVLFRRRGLLVAYAAIFAQYFSFGGVVTLLPIHLSGAGMEALHMGMLLVVFSAVFVLAQFPSGKLSDRIGRRWPVIAGLGLGIASLVLLPTQTTFPMLAVIMALYGAAYGLLFPSVSALVADHSRPEERGIATGMFHALLTTGVAIGAPIMGWVAELVGVGTGLLLTPIATALALGLALVLLRRD
jgi:MFS family permease